MPGGLGNKIAARNKRRRESVPEVKRIRFNIIETKSQIDKLKTEVDSIDTNLKNFISMIKEKTSFTDEELEQVKHIYTKLVESSSSVTHTISTNIDELNKHCVTLKKRNENCLCITAESLDISKQNKKTLAEADEEMKLIVEKTNSFNSRIVDAYNQIIAKENIDQLSKELTEITAEMNKLNVADKTLKREYKELKEHCCK